MLTVRVDDMTSTTNNTTTSDTTTVHESSAQPSPPVRERAGSEWSQLPHDWPCLFDTSVADAIAAFFAAHLE